MDLMTRLASRWKAARSRCYICREPIPEGDDFCSYECWLALQV